MPKIDVLIAGCGTNQAVYHAMKFPNSKNYAIDVSQTSLNHIKKMVKKFGIKNLDVEKKDIPPEIVNYPVIYDEFIRILCTAHILKGRHGKV